MFLESSRYYRVQQRQALTRDGREVTVVTLRRLPVVEGDPTVIKGANRLDVMAERRYGDATRFWRIADANCELYAPDLAKEAGRVIKVPPR